MAPLLRHRVRGGVCCGYVGDDMTEQLATKELFSAIKEFDEWNAVTGALPDHTSWNYECRSIMEDADREIGQLRKALKRAVNQCGHAYNCSAARGSERDCTCGWTEAKELARKLP